MVHSNFMENQADIKIGVQYDGEGAERALLDLEKLPTAARYLGEDINVAAASADKLRDALSRATESMREHLDSLEPTSAGYAKAAAQAQSYLAQQNSLANRAESAGAAFAKQADALSQLCAQYRSGVISADEFEKGCDTISQGVIKAEKAVESLEAQMRALSARQQAQASEEANTARALTDATRLETLTKQELIAETQRLLEARRAAAASGDTEGYKQLSEQLQTARKAMQALNNEQNLNKAAMAGQAVTGMQIASMLAGLAQQAKAGTLGIGDLTNGVISLSMALKAGLGPIGWVMAGLQGLQMAYDYFAEEAAEAIAKSTEELSNYADELMRLQGVQQQLAESAKNIGLKGMAEEITDVQARLTALASKQQAENARAATEAREADARAIADAETRLRLEQERINTLRAGGELTEAEASAMLRAVEDETAARKNAIEEAALLRENREAIVSKNIAREYAQRLRDELEEQLHGLDLGEALSVKLPSAEEYEAIQIRLNEGIAAAGDDARMREIEAQAAVIKEKLAAVGIELTGGTEVVIGWVEGIRKLQEQTEAAAKAWEQQAEAADQSAAASKEQLETLRERNKNEREVTAATRRAQDTQRKAQEDAAGLAKEWRAQQEKTLGEQKEWLQRTLSALKEGSEEWEKYNAELRQVNAAGVAESLQKLEETYKTSTNYAEQDNRTAAQKLAADRRMLEEKERYLQALAATPNMDAATAARVNDALAACQRELVAYKDSISANKQAAQRQLEEWQPLGLKAANAGLQGNLRRMEKAYADLAKKAEDAAQKGDEEAVNRYRKEMEKLALNIEKISGYTGQQAEQHQQLMAALEVALQGANGLSANEEQIKRIHAALGDLAEAADITARGQRRMGEAAEEGANAALKISTGLEETASTVQEAQANIRKSGEAFEKAQQVAVDLGDGLGDIGAAQENLVSAYQELSANISAELNPTGGNAGAKAEAAQEKAADATEQKAEAEQDAAAAAQRSAAAAGRSAAADEQLAAAKEQQAAAATAAAAQSQQETAAAADPAALQAAIDALNATVQEQNAQLATISTGLTTCNASLTQANTTMAQISTGIQQLGTAAAQAASAAASGLSAVQASLASLKNELTNLERQVDKIMRP